TKKRKNLSHFVANKCHASLTVRASARKVGWKIRSLIRGSRLTIKNRIHLNSRQIPMASSALQPPRKKISKKSLRTVLPDIWELVHPRRGLLAISFVLMIINRVAGLVLPYSTKFLIDNVLTRHHVELLKWLVAGILIATATQGLTSFALTQLLSKAGQR